MIKKRCVIYAKDIQRITGRSERYGQKVLSKIRVLLNKSPDQFVTVEEFSLFSGIPEAQVEMYMD
ncbi:hypothetical protein [Anditalea andensis]|uniref:Uncharacterized protein n=1 Tax=Anditalea andensis TaxID=1048983 RepID=A0A074LD57_9BACT|nr:hypothetical protein [Anditalea andensis]KEO71707.1 hypothetical protein EL17_23185 [Anditalea andensis]